MPIALEHSHRLTEMIYRPLQSLNPSTLAAFHEKHLGGQLTRLGISYIRFFYETALRLPEVLGSAALDDARLVGFVFGSTLQDHLIGRVLYKNPALSLLHTLRSACAHPAAVFQAAVRTLKDFTHMAPGFVELNFIAVDPSYQGKHIGKQLLLGFSDQVAQKGCTRFNLSVSPLNSRAKTFYEKNGGRLVGNRIEAGETMDRYQFESRKA